MDVVAQSELGVRFHGERRNIGMFVTFGGEGLIIHSFLAARLFVEPCGKGNFYYTSSLRLPDTRLCGTRSLFHNFTKVSAFRDFSNKGSTYFSVASIRFKRTQASLRVKRRPKFINKCTKKYVMVRLIFMNERTYVQNIIYLY